MICNRSGRRAHSYGCLIPSKSIRSSCLVYKARKSARPFASRFTRQTLWTLNKTHAQCPSDRSRTEIRRFEGTILSIVRTSVDAGPTVTLSYRFFFFLFVGPRASFSEFRPAVYRRGVNYTGNGKFRDRLFCDTAKYDTGSRRAPSYLSKTSRRGRRRTADSGGNDPARPPMPPGPSRGEARGIAFRRRYRALTATTDPVAKRETGAEVRNDYNHNKIPLTYTN